MTHEEREYQRLIRFASSKPDRFVIDAQRHLCSTSLRYYSRFAWRVIEPSTPLIAGWYMDCMADHAEAMLRGEIPWLIVNIPPGFGKSTLWSVFLPSYAWLTQPALRFISGSHSMALATRDTVRTRDLILSRWYQQMSGDSVRLSSVLKTYYTNTVKGHRIAVSVGGGMGMRADFGILDDPQTNAQAHSATEADGGWTWCKGEFIQRLNSSTERPSRLVVVMQRLSKMDLTARLLDHYGARFDLLCLTQRKVVHVGNVQHPTQGVTSTALTRRGIAVDPREASGDLLCPEKINEADVALRQLDAYTFAAQDQQAPVEREGEERRLHGYTPECRVAFASLFPAGLSLHEVTQAAIRDGWKFASGWDHGDSAGREVALLLAYHDGRRLLHVLDCYTNSRRTTPADDARGFRRVLDTWGILPRLVTKSRGDVNGAGKADASGDSINKQIQNATDESGLILGFPIDPPDKQAGSIELGLNLLNTFFYSRGLAVDPRASYLDTVLQRWLGDKDGTEHPIDALRYVATPLLQSFLRPQTERVARVRMA